jgi:aminoglycoside phosphotransferase family enzyme/predicted kinase
MDAEGPGPFRAVSPGVPSGAAVAETHVGVVFLVGDRAYKLKKPLQFGFVDFRTREARRAACRREVELNRRLAPDVYLGVVDVSDPDGSLCDHLVVMRRMPDDRRLSSIAAAGAPVAPHLERLADLLARFHREAASSPAVDRAAGRDVVMKRWEDNAVEMARFPDLFDPAVPDDAMALARRYLAGRKRLFEQRIEAGRARDGHGDLLADDIFCLDDGPRVLDCLEFDDELRYGDVLADVAFLAMDLERLGRADLAESFLDHYRAAAADAWPASLADHYIAYRAQVRAKVACLRWAQGDTTSADAADRLLRLCREHLRRAQVRLVLVGGAPGTGKSTVAAGVAEALGAEVIRSDVVRKELAGPGAGPRVSPGLDEGVYRPMVTDATYGELLARARRAMELGHTVVLDATWQHLRWREAAASLAMECSAELVELRCVAPVDVAVGRVERRLAAGADVSDATPEVARARADSDRDWLSATVVDTSGTPDAAVDFVLARINAADPAGGWSTALA